MLPNDPLIDRSSCLAVVPAYNEAATVGGVVSAIRRKAPQLDVLVIDDGSTDSTGACAEHAGARVLRLPFNLGIGGAPQAGFKFAHEHGYSYMVQVDGEGRHDPGEIRKLFDAMAADRADMIFAFLLSRLLRQPVTDPTTWMPVRRLIGAT
jgi:glycosyltransferase involved in cell wall biosynthesis